MQFNIIAKSAPLVNPFFSLFFIFLREKKKYFNFFQKKACFLRKDMLQYLSVWKNRRGTLSGTVVTKIFKGGKKDMPNIKSAKKRVKVAATKTMQNKMFRSQLKTEMKKYEAAVAAGDMAMAQETYKVAVKLIDKAVSRNIMHKNAAARKKSQFTKKLNAMG